MEVIPHDIVRCFYKNSDILEFILRAIENQMNKDRIAELKELYKRIEGIQSLLLKAMENAILLDVTSLEDHEIDRSIFSQLPWQDDNIIKSEIMSYTKISLILQKDYVEKKFMPREIVEKDSISKGNL